ncbi:MAG: AAA family ATPase [Peptococcaceae bacterium]|jgi:nitrogenase iron protein|nr:AAA family ATPase [Peptococcaceae bacterium]
MLNKIAVYGKGGIGKSTISANLSAALTEAGVHVLQIGCDPKHDSTRLLTRGQKITTVLDYMRVTGHADCRIKDVLFEGYAGIGCVEAGGPKPGVGCAGRGIISAFELLERFHVEDHYDAAIYDVLGDVVCGGFAVPIRREYADTIFIVTSGEFMALYAANNILRGIRNYDGEERRVAGVVYNRRDVGGEDERVARFAEAVGLPVCAVVPRSGAFARCEAENRTLIEAGYEPAGVFRDLARTVLSGLRLHEAIPLTDDGLESVVFGTGGAVSPASVPAGAASPAAPTGSADAVNPAEPTGSANAANPAPPAEADNAAAGNAADESEPAAAADDGWKRTRGENASGELVSLNVLYDDPLHGCAFNGAVTMGVHLTDAVILAHAPQSCAYISYQTISSSGRRGLFERGALLPSAVSPNLECSFMDENDVIFGGADKLEAKVLEIKKKKPKAIVVVSSCPSGIIGDDISRVLRHADADTPIIPVKTDGNLTGDYLQGMLEVYTSLARGIIKRDAETVPDTVNVVFEKVVAKNTGSNFKVIEGFLRRLGLSVNCRFLCETTFDRLRNFTSAPLSLLAYNDYTGRLLQRFFTDEYGCTFLDEGFPVGFDETKNWILHVADFFGKNRAAEDIIRECENGYRERMDALKPVLRGRRLMVVTFNHNIDWILKAAMDAGMEIVKIGILKFSQDAGFVTRLGADLNVEEDYDGSSRGADILKYRPDVMLTNYSFANESAAVLSDTIPMCPDVGFYSGLDMTGRWAALLENNLRGEWMDDQRFVNKYYA